MATSKQSDQGEETRTLLSVLAGLLGWGFLLLPLGGLLVAAGPLKAFGRISSFQETFVLLLAGAVGFVVALLWLQGKAMPPERGKLGRLLVLAALGWFGMGFASALFSEFPTQSSRTAMESAAVLAFAGGWIVISGRLRSLNSWLLLIPFLAANITLVAHAIILGLFGVNLLGVLGAGLEEGTARGSVVTLAGHPNYLGSCLVLLFFLKVFLIEREPGLRRRLIALGIADFLSIFLVGARSATLGLIGGSALLYVFKFAIPRYGVRKTVSIGIGILGAVFLVLVGIALVMLPSGGPRSGGGSSSFLARLGDRDPVTTRTHSYRGAIEIWADNPVLGAGPGRYDASFWELLGAEWEGDSDSAVASSFYLQKNNGVSPEHAHNELLHAAAERGIAGAALLLVAWTTMLLLFLESRNYPGAAATIGLGIDSQFGFPLHIPIVLPVLGAILALALVGGRTGEEGARSRRNSGILPALLIGLLGVVSFYRGAEIMRGKLAMASALNESREQRGGSIEPLLDNLEELSRIDPALMEGRRAEINFLLIGREYTEAREKVKTLTKLTHNPIDYYLAARVALAQKNYDEAQRLLDRCSGLVPGNRLYATRFLDSAYRAWKLSPSPDKLALLFEGIDRLERLDFRHPLVTLIMGELSVEFGQKSYGNRLYKIRTEPVEEVEGDSRDGELPGQRAELEQLEKAYWDSLRERINSRAAVTESG